MHHPVLPGRISTKGRRTEVFPGWRPLLTIRWWQERVRDEQRGEKGVCGDRVPTRIYRAEDANGFLAGAGLNVEALGPQIDGKFMSAFIRARKPREPAQRAV